MELGESAPWVWRRESGTIYLVGNNDDRVLSESRKIDSVWPALLRRLIWYSVTYGVTMQKSQTQFIETSSMPLNDWLSMLFNPPTGVLFVRHMFPSDLHREDYIKSINDRSYDEVIQLLQRFLIPSCSLRTDRSSFEWLMHSKRTDINLYNLLIKLQYYQRLERYCFGHQDTLPWEGTTWVLDLLPDHPDQALQALSAYCTAHIQQLPDGRFSGIGDAQEIIRAKFIGLPGTHTDAIALLLSLGPRAFECLIDRLYRAMGYQTTLTPPQKDGGRDVIARKEIPGQRELLLIECKLRTDPVGVWVCRQLLGVLSDEKATKGVLATNNRFTKPAREFAERNPRLELLGGRHLIPLMNKHLGPRWPHRIDTLVREAERGAGNGSNA